MQKVLGEILEVSRATLAELRKLNDHFDAQAQRCEESGQHAIRQVEEAVQALPPGLRDIMRGLTKGMGNGS